MKGRHLFILALLLIGCGSKHDATPVIPSKASLILPAQNSVCVTGDILSDVLSSVTFSWNGSATTDSYELHITNLSTKTPLVTQATTDNKLTVSLSRSTPFSWYIISKSGGNNMQSDTWKFYNSGPGTISYAPFPADLIFPSLGTSVTPTAGTINLTWKGSDVNNDVLTYDVYFGSTLSPAILKAGVADMFLNLVPVTSGATYYWKVISKDTNGNTSDSGLYSFSVK